MFLCTADEDSVLVAHRWCSEDNGACICYNSNWLLQQCYSQFKCSSRLTPAKCTHCSASTCVAKAEVWPYHCWHSGLFTLATTSAAGRVQGQFIDLQVPPSSSSIISGWDVHSHLSSVHNWRLICFPELTGHHHCTSVTVLAVKFVCANTNLLTYLLIVGELTSVFTLTTVMAFSEDKH